MGTLSWYDWYVLLQKRPQSRQLPLRSVKFSFLWTFSRRLSTGKSRWDQIQRMRWLRSHFEVANEHTLHRACESSNFHGSCVQDVLLKFLVGQLSRSTPFYGHPISFEPSLRSLSSVQIWLVRNFANYSRYITVLRKAHIIIIKPLVLSEGLSSSSMLHDFS